MIIPEMYIYLTSESIFLSTYFVRDARIEIFLFKLFTYNIIYLILYIMDTVVFVRINYFIINIYYN